MSATYQSTFSHHLMDINTEARSIEDRLEVEFFVSAILVLEQLFFGLLS